MSNENTLTDYERERLIIQYIASVERGDWETVEDILHQACDDAELVKMILAAGEEALDESDRCAIEKTIDEFQFKQPLPFHSKMSYE